MLRFSVAGLAFIALFSMGKESSIVFNFGYMGVMGTIDAVTDGNDTIIIDSLSHDNRGLVLKCTIVRYTGSIPALI